VTTPSATTASGPTTRKTDCYDTDIYKLWHDAKKKFVSINLFNFQKEQRHQPRQHQDQQHVGSMIYYMHIYKLWHDAKHKMYSNSFHFSEETTTSATTTPGTTTRKIDELLYAHLQIMA
jgi:hypothetical protein